MYNWWYTCAIELVNNRLELMKAIILVGGYGTRMRPLTFHCPKPIFPFISKTPVEYMVEVRLQTLRH